MKIFDYIKCWYNINFWKWYFSQLEIIIFYASICLLIILILLFGKH